MSSGRNMYWGWAAADHSLIMPAWTTLSLISSWYLQFWAVFFKTNKICNCKPKKPMFNHQKLDCLCWFWKFAKEPNVGRNARIFGHSLWKQWAPLKTWFEVEFVGVRRGSSGFVGVCRGLVWSEIPMWKYGENRAQTGCFQGKPHQFRLGLGKKTPNHMQIHRIFTQRFCTNFLIQVFHGPVCRSSSEFAGVQFSNSQFVRSSYGVRRSDVLNCFFVPHPCFQWFFWKCVGGLKRLVGKTKKYQARPDQHLTR